MILLQVEVLCYRVRQQSPRPLQDLYQPYVSGEAILLISLRRCEEELNNDDNTDISSVSIARTFDTSTKDTSNQPPPHSESSGQSSGDNLTAGNV